MNKDESSLFRGEMKGVKRHVSNNQTLKGGASRALDPKLEAKRHAAVTEKQGEPNFLDTEHVELVGPHDPIGWKKAGVQEGVYRKLRLGKYPIEASLDLHRLTVAQARQEVFKFIKECQKRQIRTAVITHGKGDRSETPAKIKSFVNHWLQQLPQVLAFNSTQQQHGGVGAVYVLIQKSESSKLSAREQFNKRSPSEKIGE